MIRLSSLCLAVIALLFLSCDAAFASKKPYVRYAVFLEDTQVDLSDGARWMMDKGDCFPIYMFKERQTKVVLKLGAATFMTDRQRLRIMDEKEESEALVSYRKNLATYLKNQPDKWKDKEMKP